MAMQDHSRLPESCLLSRVRKTGVMANGSACAYEATRVALSMKLGDCVIFADDALHRSEALKSPTLRARYALFTRLFRSDVKPASVNHSPLVLPHAACAITAYPHRPHDSEPVGSAPKPVDLQSACFPQVYPKMKLDEMRLFSNATFDPWLQLDPLINLHGYSVYQGLVRSFGMQ